jgi:hypothetical protein
MNAIRIQLFWYNIRIVEDFLPKFTSYWFILYSYSFHVTNTNCKIEITINASIL